MLREQERAIEWDCSSVLTRFYDFYDRWDYKAMVALFSPDGLWHRAGKKLMGRDAIMAELRLRPANQKVRHVLSNFLVDVVDGRHALLSCYLTVYRHEGCTPSESEVLIQAPSLFLRVTAGFEKTSDVWLISNQVMRRDFLFPAKGG
ncbi:MAG: nuclear transport factor 2 family protein [Burkholderiales bacterium]|nr:nuclear transport factor 2 family protein [Burkholderiales bacterium]